MDADLQNLYPRLSISIIVMGMNGKKLFAKRLTKHAPGKFGCPAGKVDFGESVIVAAHREGFEETGMRLKCIPIPCVANCFFPKESKHFFCQWFLACSLEDGTLLTGTEKIDFVEKDAEGNPKFEAWNWYDDEESKALPLMPSTRFAIESITSGFKDRPITYLSSFQLEECVVND